MKFNLLIITLLLLCNIVFAQPAGYYDAASGKSGQELKSALNDIISGHVDFSYSQARYIMNYTDADVNNPNNVILFYTQRSQDATTYGTGGDYINREHVWAKSHGNFAGIRPMDGDVHNLRPEDGSVNEDKSNKDFGKVQPNGFQHSEATECWYNENYWEPGPSTKGQVARIVFYMATRYEGEEGEMDLEALNGITNGSLPTHGDMSALLEWNRQYPPSDFERRRNERIFSIQRNRNPFVDNPEFADLIWADKSPKNIVITKTIMEPEFPKPGDVVRIEAYVSSGDSIESVKLLFGKSFGSNSDQNDMIFDGEKYYTRFICDEYSPGEMLYFRVMAKTSKEETYINGSVEISKDIDKEDITSINTIQGNTDASPYIDSIVTIAGRVNSNFDNSFYIQQGDDTNNGICVFGTLKTGHEGDSIVVTGKVVEYNNLTEMSDVSYFYNFKNNKPVTPVGITVSQIGEQYEGMLVKIDNVTFPQGGVVIPDENSSYNFSDGTGTATLYSRYGSRLVGKKVPKGVTSVTGIVSQFQNTYQILVRDYNDFDVEDDKSSPEIVNVSILDKEWITVEFDEAVDKVSSENALNYSFSDNIKVIAAYRYEDGTTVILQIENLSIGNHTLTINRVSDVLGNEMANKTFDFYSSLTSVNHINANSIRIKQFASGRQISIASENIIDEIKVIDITGRCIYKVTPHAISSDLFLNGLNGVVILKIKSGRGEEIIKKVVIH